MTVPTADPPSEKWWVASDKKATGPFGSGYVIAALRSGVISPDQLLCDVGGNTWHKARDWPQFRPHIPIRTENHPRQSNPKGRSGPLVSVVHSIDWIKIGVIYGLIANPLLFAWGIATSSASESILAPDAPSYQLETMIRLQTHVMGIGLAILWILSGWWLHCRKCRGLWVSIAACIATHACLAVILIFSVVFALATAGQPTRETTEVHFASDLVSYGITFLEYVFQNVLVIMLWKSRKSILWNDGSFK